MGGVVGMVEWVLGGMLGVGVWGVGLLWVCGVWWAICLGTMWRGVCTTNQVFG